MKKDLYILIGLLLGVVSANAQQKKFGALPMDKEKLKKVQVVMSEKKKRGFTVGLIYKTKLAAKGKPDRIAPTVSIISPTSGQNFDFNAVVNIKTAYSDNVGVTSSYISIDNKTVSTSTSYAWTADASGPHTIIAYARDAAGNSRSATLQFTVNTIIITPPPPPPPPPPVDTTPTPPPPVLPASVSISMPAVQYQGGEGSCVAFAVCYARDVLGNIVTSPEFVYDRIKNPASGCGSGSALLSGCDFLRDTGVCLWSTYPYSYSNGCSNITPAAANAEAGSYRTKGYSQILSSDVTAIKTVLASGKPLVFQCTVDNNFYYATAGFVWKSFGSAMGIHALCLCGYDDAKHAYKIINSWGTSWGDAGYGWIDYDFYPTACSNLLVFNY